MAAASLKTEMTPSSHVFPDRVIALLYILCKFACTNFRNIDINTYSAHVYDNTLNSSHSGIKLPRYLLYIHLCTTWLLYIVYIYYFSGQCLCTCMYP